MMGGLLAGIQKSSTKQLKKTETNDRSGVAGAAGGPGGPGGPPRPGPPAAGGPPGRGGLLAALSAGQSTLKKSSGPSSPGGGGPKPAASPGPLSMMDQIKQRQASMKKTGGGGDSPIANQPPKAAPKGFNTALLNAQSKAATKKSSKIDDDSDDDWDDVSDPKPATAKKVSPDPPKTASAPTMPPKPAAPLTKPAAPPTMPPKPAAPKSLSAAPPKPSAPRPGPPVTQSKGVGPPPPIKPSTSGRPSASSTSSPYQRSASNASDKSSSPAPTLSWKEKNALKKKEDAAKRAEKKNKPPVNAPAPAPAPAPTPSPAHVTATRTSSSVSNAGSIGGAADSLESLRSQLEAQMKKNRNLEEENRILQQRLDEVEQSPGKQRRDSAAFKDMSSLNSSKDKDIQRLSEELESCYDRLSAYESGSKGGGGGGGGNIDMQEMSSLRRQLKQARKDKEKALKLVVKMVGKEKLSQHLREHEDMGDGLKTLVKSFGSMGVGGGGRSPEKGYRGSPMNKTMPNMPLGLSGGLTTTPKPGASPGTEFKRNRMDSYFRTAI